MRIRTKLSLVLLACAVVPLVTLAALLYRQAQRDIIAAQMGQLDTVSNYKLKLIQELYVDMRRDIQTLAELDEVRQASQLLRAGLTPGLVARLDAEIAPYARRRSIVDVELLDPDGDIVYSSHPRAHRGKHHSRKGSALFEEGSRQVYFDVLTTALADLESVYVMAVSAPVRAADGRLLGVVVCEFDVSRFYSVIQDYEGLGQTGEIVLARFHEGNVLVINPLRHDPDAAFTRMVSLDGAAPNPIALAVRGEVGRGVVTDYRGKQVIAVWHPLPELKLGMVHKIDVDEAFQDIYRAREEILWISILVAVLGGAIAVGVSESLSRPIYRLQNAAERVAAGELHHRLDADWPDDELGRLAVAFNGMTQARQRAEAELRDSEERFRAIFECSPVGMVIGDPSTSRFTLANRAFCDMLGYQAQDLVGLPMAAVAHAEDFRGDGQEGTLFKSASPGVLRRYVSKSGHTVWVELTVALVQGERESYAIGVAVDVTARRAAAEALRESEGRYRRIVETAQEGIWWVDDQGATVFANRRMADIVGWPLAEMYGRHFADFMEAKVAQQAEGSLQKLIRGESLKTETRLMRRDGSPVWVLLSASSIREGTTGYLGTLAMATDITARKRMERALSESEKRYRLLIESAYDAIVISDSRTGVVIDVNQRAQDLFLLPAERLVGMHQAQLHPPEEAERYLVLLHEHLGTGRDIAEDMMICRGDGLRVPVDISAKELEFGGRLLTVCVFRDVTERRKMIDQLRKLSRAVEQSPSGVLITDTEGHIEYANPKITQITGYRLDELLGNTPALLRSDRTAPDTYRELWGLISQGQEWRGEMLNRRKDGESFWTRTLVSPIRDVHGQFTHFLAEMEDISALKRAEELSRRQQDELAHASRLITMGEMASALAHEINQPLTAIVNYSGGCVRSLRSAGWRQDEIEEALQEIHAQAIRAGKVVSSIREFVKRRESRREPLDVNEVARAMAHFARLHATAHEVAIELELQQRLPLALADKIQVEQVLLNLIRNGVEAMVNTPPAVRRLLVATHEAGPRQIEVTVSDRGCGLPPGFQTDTLPSFFSTKPDGMGMGLTISRGIIESQGGRLWATAHPEGGSIFHFTLLT